MKIQRKYNVSQYWSSIDMHTDSELIAWKIAFWSQVSNPTQLMGEPNPCSISSSSKRLWKAYLTL